MEEKPAPWFEELSKISSGPNKALAEWACQLAPKSQCECELLRAVGRKSAPGVDCPLLDVLARELAGPNCTCPRIGPVACGPPLPPHLERANKEEEDPNRRVRLKINLDEFMPPKRPLAEALSVHDENIAHATTDNPPQKLEDIELVGRGLKMVSEGKQKFTTKEKEEKLHKDLLAVVEENILKSKGKTPKEVNRNMVEIENKKVPVIHEDANNNVKEKSKTKKKKVPTATLR